MNTKRWYITGASKGMGLSLVKQLLAQGHKVAGTSRSLEDLQTHVGVVDNFLALQVDLTNDISVEQSIKQTIETFGGIDVIINNAGYGIGGALEELSSEDIRDNFEINFFAAIRVIQHVTPYLRAQHFGHIINISSIAGFAPGSGWAGYVAAKFALSGLSEALANELKPFGINVSVVYPGWFRTNFAKPDSIVFGKKQISDYQFIREAHINFNKMDGAQLGDPDKMAHVFLKLVNHPNPPVNLFIGSDSYLRAQSRIESLSKQLYEWKEDSYSTDFLSSI